MKKTVAHPERHLAVFCQQGHVKDKAAQELLQHGGPEVSENEVRCRDKSIGAPRTPLTRTLTSPKTNGALTSNKCQLDTDKKRLLCCCHRVYKNNNN